MSSINTFEDFKINIRADFWIRLPGGSNELMTNCSRIFQLNIINRRRGLDASTYDL